MLNRTKAKLSLTQSMMQKIPDQRVHKRGGKRKPRQSIGNPIEDAKVKRENDQIKKLMVKIFVFIPKTCCAIDIFCQNWFNF